MIIASDIVTITSKNNLPKVITTNHIQKLPPTASVKNPATAVIIAIFINALIMLMFY